MTSVRRLAVVLTAATVLLSAWSSPPTAVVASSEFPTADGQASSTGQLPAGGSFSLQVAGRGGVPADASSVVVNVAVTNPTAASFITVSPSGAARPNAANLVFSAGQTIPNLVVVKVGGNGKITFFNNSGAVDIVVDVQGFFPNTTAFRGVVPARLLDTRQGYATIDGQSAGFGPLGPGQTLNLGVVGRGGVPVTGVGAVALNVTAVDPTANSFVTVWPQGGARPTAANLNLLAGSSRPNMVIAKVASNGRISLFNFAGSTHLVVDVLGWFPTGGGFTGLTPARLLDTRAGLPTIDGQFSGTGPVGTDTQFLLPVAGRGGIPATGVGAVAVNVAVTNPSASSFLTVYPSGSPRPTAANLNFTAGQTVPNLVIVKVGADGKIALYNLSGSTDVVVDVLGWFPVGTGYAGLVPTRLMDSRGAPSGTVGTTPPVPVTAEPTTAGAATTTAAPATTADPGTAPPTTASAPTTAPPPDILVLLGASSSVTGSRPVGGAVLDRTASLTLGAATDLAGGRTLTGTIGTVPVSLTVGATSAVTSARSITGTIGSGSVTLNVSAASALTAARSVTGTVGTSSVSLAVTSTSNVLFNRTVSGTIGSSSLSLTIEFASSLTDTRWFTARTSSAFGTTELAAIAFAISGNGILW
jgi:hypothetical protein